ncbi:hypothetical protein MA16_Dca001923 [Dendrobium catenatum]|uniref:Uncharacterized protein n=1 Tax=Dendrobium catenatum TaxID=906689 RepID=A0A2I0XDV9_9ASPA|nr:hypothetical protein MA16_Dca001923 [Dendrobium catenatum]
MILLINHLPQSSARRSLLLHPIEPYILKKVRDLQFHLLLYLHHHPGASSSPRVSRVRDLQIHLQLYLHTSLATSLLPGRVLTTPLQIRHMPLYSIHITLQHHHMQLVHPLLLPLLTPTHITTPI